MSVTWDDPPPRRNLVFGPDVLDELRSRPGRWALIRRYRNHSHKPQHPADVELRHRYCGPEVLLYARSKP